MRDSIVLLRLLLLSIQVLQTKIKRFEVGVSPVGHRLNLLLVAVAVAHYWMLSQHTRRAMLQLHRSSKLGGEMVLFGLTMSTMAAVVDWKVEVNVAEVQEIGKVLVCAGGHLLMLAGNGP